MRTRALILTTAILATAAAQSVAAIVVFNQLNPPDGTGLPSGGWGTYRGFSVNFNDSALDQTADGLESGTALADYSTVFLTSLVIRHSGSQGAQPAAPTGDWTDALLKVYTSQTPTVASFVGDATTRNDVSWGGSERNITFEFDFLALDPGTTYYFYLSNTAGNVDPADQSWTSGRFRVSNDATHTYPSGNLINNAWGNQDTAFDAVFAATFSSIPEPGVALSGLLGLLLLARRRR